MADETISISSGLIDIFAECDSCGCRTFETITDGLSGQVDELVCTSCGMAYAAMSPRPADDDCGAVGDEVIRAA